MANLICIQVLYIWSSQYVKPVKRFPLRSSINASMQFHFTFQYLFLVQQIYCAFDTQNSINFIGSSYSCKIRWQRSWSGWQIHKSNHYQDNADQQKIESSRSIFSSTNYLCRQDKFDDRCSDKYWSKLCIFCSLRP